MRTDSVRVSQQAQAEAKKFIIERFSEKYAPEKPNLFKVKSGAQDAHEAIRPTSVFRTPETVKEFLSRDQYRLYTLIWEQFVASQMAEAVFKQVRVDIEADGGLFRATGQRAALQWLSEASQGGGRGPGKGPPAASDRRDTETARGA